MMTLVLLNANLQDAAGQLHSKKSLKSSPNHKQRDVLIVGRTSLFRILVPFRRSAKNNGEHAKNDEGRNLKWAKPKLHDQRMALHYILHV